MTDGGSVDAESNAEVRTQLGPPPCRPPDVPDDPDVRELRLALVCYGGVSLAIYMHGITKELEKLVRASNRYELGPDSNPFPPTETEHAYFDALARKEERDGFRTRVVVDIISGTSAGGINGICLAKALAHDATQEELRHLWLTRGAILGLLSRKRLLPPLAGSRILRWVRAALDDMDANGAGSLMPSGLSLDLFVTTTDLHGYNRRIPIEDPASITTVINKHVLEFHHRDQVGGLDAGSTPALAFSARATSCFPGAFPPTAIAEIEPPSARDPFTVEFFRVYELAGAAANDTFFVDGGVLDNFPFRSAVRAIAGKPAATEVDRKLLFIEPDPSDLLAPADGRTPTFKKTVWSALSTLPRRQPISEALDELSAYNRRVRRVKQMIRACRQPVAQRVIPLLDGPYEQVNAAVNNLVIAQTGLAYEAYLRLKLTTVLERMAEAAARLSDYPANSSHASFVRAAILVWGTREGLLPAEDVSGPGVADRLDDPQLSFLRTFDLDYGERRLHFVIRRLNDFFGELERDDLNRAKHSLYEFVCELRTALEGPEVRRIREEARSIFEEHRLGRLIRDGAVPGFVDEAGEELSSLRDSLGAHLETQLDGFGERVYGELNGSLTQDWPQAARDDLRAHYLGFPFWDSVIFPARQLSEVGELDEVEVIRVSPLDAKRLEADPKKQSDKLKGVGIHHFAAFFRRSWRENDYLWGRLDGAERLLWLLEDASDRAHAAAFRAILAGEQAHLPKARKLLRRVQRYVDEH